MIKLKSHKHKYLTENIISCLAQNHIVNILEFLQEDAEKLSKVTKLDFSQVIEIRSDIYTTYAAPVLNGLNLYEKNFASKKLISTGFENLDLALDGGFPVGYISEICGLASSGKTQLCIQLAINHVKNSDSTVLYIDTKGDFSAIQIQKILDMSGISYKDMAIIMLKIKVVYIWNMYDLIDLIKKLKNGLIENLSLIIIDSLPCLMFQHFGDDNKIGYTFLNTFVNGCRLLCKEKQISVICVNLQTRWVHQNITDIGSQIDEEETPIESKKYKETHNRCLGKYWQHIPALVIILQKKPDSSNNKNPSLLLDVTVYKLNVSQIVKKCLLMLNITEKS